MPLLFRYERCSSVRELPCTQIPGLSLSTHGVLPLRISMTLPTQGQNGTVMSSSTPSLYGDPLCCLERLPRGYH